MTNVVSSLRFEPVLPGWLLIALLAAACVAVAVGLWQRARGAVWRAAAFAVLLGWLAGPMLIEETRQGLSDIGLMVVDDSASMQVGDRARLAARAAAALAAQAARIPGLELRRVSVPESGHDGTRLWSGLRQALADIPADRLAGILAITDGQVHDLPDPATRLAAPLNVLIPAEGEEWDRRVRVIEAPGYGIVGHTLNLKVVVEDLGPSTGGGAGGRPGAPPGTATLTVQRDGAPAIRREVTPGEVQTVPVEITRAGPMLVKLATPPVPGEASPLNNQTVVQINGVRDRLRVLLVSGEPNQGERTWRRLLKSDPSVDLVHFTILRPPEKDDTTPLNELALIAFPTRELFQDKLGGFDLIILDRFTDRGILPHIYLRNIADYVRHGGALLLAVGPEFAGSRSLDQTPLGAVLPVHSPLSGDGVIDGAFVPKVSDLGQRHPVTEGLAGGAGAAQAPGQAWGPWYRAIAGEDPQGQVLMTGPNQTPLLVLSHVGEGRAAMLMSDQIWLWSRGHQGGGPQAELLRRVSHWLMKEPELDEERLTARIADGHLLIERRSVAGDAAGQVSVTPPEGAARNVMLAPAGAGRATASLDAPAPGVWQVGDGTRMAYAAVGLDNPLEYADLRATADRVRKLAVASGGGVAWLGRGIPSLRRVGAGDAAAGPGWVGFRSRDAHLVTGVASVPLLPGWAALPLLLALIVGAWWREAK